MPDDFRRQLQDRFEQKDTAELLALWQQNDRVKWSSQTFEVIEKILRARLGEVPPQNEPILESTAESEDQKEVVNPASPLYPYLASENAPVLYKPRDVLRLERWLNRLAWVFAGFRLLYGLVSTFPAGMGPSYWLERGEVLFLVLAFGSLIINAAIPWLMLKGLAILLKMLMQMEFSSRGIGTRQ